MAQLVWGEGGGRPQQEPQEPGEEGLHKQEGQIQLVHSSDSLWLWAEEQAQAGLLSWKAASTWHTDMGIC